ncbi:MAG: hypothetical protein J0G33_10765 [Afipia felis]|nr:hypothetical protein [Afipia felis]
MKTGCRFSAFWVLEFRVNDLKSPRFVEALTVKGIKLLVLKRAFVRFIRRTWLKTTRRRKFRPRHSCAGNQLGFPINARKSERPLSGDHRCGG